MSSSSTTESAHTTSSTTSSKGVGAGAGAKAKSARQKRDQRRLDAVAEQIKDHIAAGRFYEAEQCHKSLYNRFARQGFHDQIASICEVGAVQLLAKDQGGGSGSEVALLYLKALEGGNVSVTQEVVDSIVEISRGFPSEHIAAQVEFLKKAISWSARCGDEKGGSPYLNEHLALLLASVQDVGGAQMHFVRAQKPRLHAQFLAKYLKSTEVVENDEHDLIVLTTVLEYLTRDRLPDARGFVDEAERIVPSRCSPLKNFTDRLLEAVVLPDASPFQMLLTRYKSHLERDESLGKSLDKIGERYFGLKSTSAGGLDSLLTGMFSSK